MLQVTPTAALQSTERKTPLIEGEDTDEEDTLQPTQVDLSSTVVRTMRGRCACVRACVCVHSCVHVYCLWDKTHPLVCSSDSNAADTTISFSACSPQEQDETSQPTGAVGYEENPSLSAVGGTPGPKGIKQAVSVTLSSHHVRHLTKHPTIQSPHTICRHSSGLKEVHSAC